MMPNLLIYVAGNIKKISSKAVVAHAFKKKKEKKDQQVQHLTLLLSALVVSPVVSSYLVEML